jgi:hypothetical protein
LLQQTQKFQEKATIKKNVEAENNQVDFTSIFQGKIRVSPIRAINVFCKRFKLKGPSIKLIDPNMCELSLTMPSYCWIGNPKKLSLQKDVASVEPVGFRLIKVIVRSEAPTCKLAAVLGAYRLLCLFSQTIPTFPLLMIPPELQSMISRSNVT